MVVAVGMRRKGSKWKLLWRKTNSSWWAIGYGRQRESKMTGFAHMTRKKIVQSTLKTCWRRSTACPALALLDLKNIVLCHSSNVHSRTMKISDKFCMLRFYLVIIFLKHIFPIASIEKNYAACIIYNSVKKYSNYSEAQGKTGYSTYRVQWQMKI